jgi:membrane fusion protein (multidrug efflux system)
VEVSTESVKQSKSRLAQAQAQQAEAEAVAAGADIVLPKLAVSQSQLKTADATIEQLKAAVAQAELDLSYTVISAPEAGRVTRRTVERGAFVQPGEELFAVVPNRVWVIANYKETELTYMRPGQEVVIEVDTYPGKYLQGKVDSIQSGTGARFSLLPPENATGNYVKVVQRVPVKIVFDGEPWNNELLAPGLSVEAEVKIR